MEIIYKITEYIQSIMFVSILAKIAKDMILIKRKQQAYKVLQHIFTSNKKITHMNKFKAVIASLLLILAVCSFIEAFNKYNTDTMIWFLLSTMCMSVILSTLLVKSIK